MCIKKAAGSGIRIEKNSRFRIRKKWLWIPSPAYLFRRKLAELQSAGLDTLNISLDTLIPDKFEFISRRPKAAHGKEGHTAYTLPW